jgi:hypothetical protein
MLVSTDPKKPLLVLAVRGVKSVGAFGNDDYKGNSY